MIRETLYIFPVLSKDCDDSRGRYALYRTLEYWVGMLRNEKEMKEEMRTNIEDRDE
jgi:predicted double-glycine peptidase